MIYFAVVWNRKKTGVVSEQSCFQHLSSASAEEPVENNPFTVSRLDAMQHRNKSLFSVFVHTGRYNNTLL